MTFREYEHYVTIRKYDGIPESELNTLYELRIAFYRQIKTLARFVIDRLNA